MTQLIKSNEMYNNAEIYVEKEDMMDINEPVIKMKSFNQLYSIPNKIKPQFVDYLTEDRHRTFLICGNLHSGKTSLVDYLISSTLQSVTRFTDHHILEKAKKVSILSTPISLQVSGRKTMQFNMIDMPGHSGCIYEYQNLLIADGCTLVIDVVEGVQLVTRTTIEYCLKYSIKMVVILNKIDRLIVELKLPPFDAYQKILCVINDLNRHILKCGGDLSQKIDPLLDNIAFSSLKDGWCFTLMSFAEQYLAKSKITLPLSEFTPRLWQNYEFKDSKFVKSDKCTTFSDFILEPLYKIYGIVLGDPVDDVKAFISAMNIRLPQSIHKQNPNLICKAVLQTWIGSPIPVIHLISQLPPFSDSKSNYLCRYPDTHSLIYKSIESFHSDMNVIQVANIYYFNRLYALGKVVSGAVIPGNKFRVRSKGEEFIEIISELYIPFARSLISLKSAKIGEIFLFPVTENVRPYSLFVSSNFTGPIESFENILMSDPKWLYIAIEPRIPSHLKRMLEHVVVLTRMYPGIEFKMEDSGEYGLFSPSEFLLDCALHDLRYFCDCDIRVSDPVAKLRETVMESSQIQCHSISPNLKYF
eukprot:NODE_5_length_72347_cov_1.339331.p12 type:complete len:584 gc:universal NODE_5_length_72347_cov_1.339331:45124-43373(-)